ncbi:hypothetical protein [Tuberibacillus calidus]|jgi:hypothetical protein|uniref:hypothetical protein n=1 Tax=Tuberibacillus calidus TaxID=340097 RepID=UPI0003F80B7B|nr:hypothetical protein [Tuberibacillus calidus]
MKGKIFFPSFLLLLLIIIGFLMYNETTFFDSLKLDHQLNQIIEKKDMEKMKEISLNDRTYQFLGNLPKNAHCSRTSGVQANNGQLEYFVTDIKDQKFDVLLKESFSKFLILPIRHVKIDSISIQN